MRDTKFRVWLGTRFWFFDITSGFNIENTDVCTEPEQFTGLLDSKGQEIFEGDIIRGKKDSLGSHCDHVIVWDNDAARFACVFSHDPDSTNYMSFTKSWVAMCEKKIVGNIHQNKKLLEPTK